MKSKKSQITSEILRKTSKAEHKLYHVDFKTKEYSVIGETHPQTIKNNEQIVQISLFKKTASNDVVGDSHYSQRRMKRINDYSEPMNIIRPYSLVDKTIQFVQENYIVIMLIAMMAFLYSNKVFARNPQGEFSALLENKKSRENFKDKKEMMKFIKKEEKKYEKRKSKGKQNAN